MKKEKLKIISAMMSGIVIGGTAGLLFAPKKGKETREDIKNTILKISNKVKYLTNNNFKNYINKELNKIDIDIINLGEIDSYRKAKKLAKKTIKRINKLIKYTKKNKINDFEDLINELKDKTEEISAYILSNL